MFKTKILSLPRIKRYMMKCRIKHFCHKRVFKLSSLKLSFGTNINGIKHALQELKAEGYIYSIKGDFLAVTK